MASIAPTLEEHLNNGDTVAVAALIKDHPQLLVPNLWFPAIKSKSAACCDFLLASGLDPNNSGADRPPLHFAAYEGCTAAAQKLIEAGADVNSKDGENLTPLDTLFEYGAVVDSPELVDILLEAGTEVSFWTAVRLGNAAEVAQSLAADPTLLNQPAPDAMTRTPLMLAAQCGHGAVLDLLLEAGAAVNTADGAGCTALYYAAEGRRKNRAPLIESLLAAGAAVNTVERRGVAPLHQAAAWGHADVVAALLHGGADRTLAFGEGQTPLSLATKFKHEDVVRLLQA